VSWYRCKWIFSARHGDKRANWSFSQSTKAAAEAKARREADEKVCWPEIIVLLGKLLKSELNTQWLPLTNLFVSLGRGRGEGEEGDRRKGKCLGDTLRAKMWSQWAVTNVDACVVNWPFLLYIGCRRSKIEKGSRRKSELSPRPQFAHEVVV
jgi:hypothetical protein